MPPRWPRKPDRRDPAFRKLDDRMTFAVHVALFAAVNSGLWFAHQINVEWVPWVSKVTLVWLVGLVAHAAYIFAIADYSNSYVIEPDDAPEGGG
ncbi:2TM domain-containing protein [Oscillatoria sp. CS-180]|uniref:2TM domain-containing protein n=1 Tax=Oscillatoria sp. CS-180 TaxID=3021720 RepID=UPI0023309F4B|nr:2TM domain-containing protein [Oscillatoria sp. CS-180]MDB9526637.1 2TM domain-containing protein [Oscillatoria sp. CS-180]